MNRVFVLSPANCNGVRARWLLRKDSRSALAQRLRSPGAPLGEVFSFLSALYFRGKLAYAEAFSRPPLDCPGILIITPTAGLVPHDTLIRLPNLRRFARLPIHIKNLVYCSSLQRSAKKLVSRMGPDCEVVLLGSLASRKYLEILGPIFESRLMVPGEFIGRGDMSRGGLLLRHVRDNRELNYIDGAILTGRKNRSRQKANWKLHRSSLIKTSDFVGQRQDCPRVNVHQEVSMGVANNEARLKKTSRRRSKPQSETKP